MVWERPHREEDGNNYDDEVKSEYVQVFTK